jgi:hypothetical protein
MHRRDLTRAVPRAGIRHRHRRRHSYLGRSPAAQGSSTLRRFLEDRLGNQQTYLPLDVLKHAETSLRPQLHRQDIRSLSRYFGAVVRDAFDKYRADHDRKERFDQQCADSVARAQHTAALRRTRLTNPVSWLREALAALVTQWLPAERQLLFGGEGAALGWIRGALQQILSVHGCQATLDITRGLVDDCVRSCHDRLGEPGADAIRNLLQRELNALLRAPPNSSCAPDPPLATLWNTGRTPRPPPPKPLPI